MECPVAGRDTDFADTVEPLTICLEPASLLLLILLLILLLWPLVLIRGFDWLSEPWASRDKTLERGRERVVLLLVPGPGEACPTRSFFFVDMRVMVASNPIIGVGVNFGGGDDNAPVSIRGGGSGTAFDGAEVLFGGNRRPALQGGGHRGRRGGVSGEEKKSLPLDEEVLSSLFPMGRG